MGSQRCASSPPVPTITSKPPYTLIPFQIMPHLVSLQVHSTAHPRLPSKAPCRRTFHNRTLVPLRPPLFTLMSLRSRSPHLSRTLDNRQSTMTTVRPLQSSVQLCVHRSSLSARRYLLPGASPSHRNDLFHKPVRFKHLFPCLHPIWMAHSPRTSMSVAWAPMDTSAALLTSADFAKPSLRSSRTHNDEGIAFIDGSSCGMLGSLSIRRALYTAY